MKTDDAQRDLRPDIKLGAGLARHLKVHPRRRGTAINTHANAQRTRFTPAQSSLWMPIVLAVTALVTALGFVLAHWSS